MQNSGVVARRFIKHISPLRFGRDDQLSLDRLFGWLGCDATFLAALMEVNVIAVLRSK